MKKLLCLLIFSTFFGSSFQLFTVGPITVSLFRLIFVLFVFLSFVFVKKNEKMPVCKKYIIALGVIGLISIFTVFFTPSISTFISGTVFHIINILLIYYIYIYTDTEADLKAYMLSFFAGLALNSIISVYEYLTQNHITSHNYTEGLATNSWEYSVLIKAPTAFLYNPNNIGMAVIIGLPFGLLLSKRFKWLFFTAWTTLSVYVTFATGSRSAIILIFLSLIFCVLLATNTFSKKLVLASSLLIIGFILYAVFEDFIWEQLVSSELIKTNSINDLGNERFELMAAAIKLSLKNLLLGTGPGSAEELIKEAFGIQVSSVHNLWGELLLTLGAIPLILFIYIYLKCVLVQFRLRNNDISNAVILISLLMFSIAVFIPPTTITLHLAWTIFGFSLAAEKLYYLKTGILV